MQDFNSKSLQGKKEMAKILHRLKDYAIQARATPSPTDGSKNDYKRPLIPATIFCRSPVLKGLRFYLNELLSLPLFFAASVWLCATRPPAYSYNSNKVEIPSRKVYRKSLCMLIITVFILLFLYGCGGGFDDDSSNAHKYQKSIFGTDSLE
jgi:hypothetical protein